MRIYVGCSLTHAPLEFRTKVEALKWALRQKGHEVLDFVGLEHGTAQDVYHWDIHRCVPMCDLFVAICDYPALGLGYELGVAVEKLGKNVLAVAHTDAKITRLVLGIDHPDFQLIRYEDLYEVIRLVPEATESQLEFQWDGELAAA